MAVNDLKFSEETGKKFGWLAWYVLAKVPKVSYGCRFGGSWVKLKGLESNKLESPVPVELELRLTFWFSWVWVKNQDCILLAEEIFNWLWFKVHLGIEDTDDWVIVESGWVW